MSACDVVNLGSVNRYCNSNRLLKYTYLSTEIKSMWKGIAKCLVLNIVPFLKHIKRVDYKHLSGSILNSKFLDLRIKFLCKEMIQCLFRCASCIFDYEGECRWIIVTCSFHHSLHIYKDLPIVSNQNGQRIIIKESVKQPYLAEYWHELSCLLGQRDSLRLVLLDYDKHQEEWRKTKVKRIITARVKQLTNVSGGISS